MAPQANERDCASMMSKEHGMSVKIAGQSVGDGNPCYVVAEIGINHNGDMAIAKRLIDVAVAARATMRK
jgi:sialic acid synthase SpsE